MKPRHAANSIVLVLLSVGCQLGNPLIVTSPDSGGVSGDIGFDAAVQPDVGADVIDDRADAVARDVIEDTGSDIGTANDVVDVPPPIDVPPDTGMVDTGPLDTGPLDTGPLDTGVVDTGPLDTGPVDTGVIDAGPLDTGVIDAGPPDTGVIDAGPPDTGVIDAGPPDTGPVDVGVDVPVIPDTGPADAGPTVISTYSESCASPGPTLINGPGRYSLPGSTLGRNGDHRPSCANNSAPDVGYPIRLSTFSRLTWTSRPTASPVFVPVIYFTQNCQAQSGTDSRFRDELACVSNLGAPGLTRGGVVDLPAGDYYLVVDGAEVTGGPLSGQYEVTLDIVASENSPAYSVEAVSTRSCSTIPSGQILIMSGDDVVSPVQTLPFTFRYFGTPVTRFAVYDNGFLSFLANGATPWPAATSWRNHTITFDGLPGGVVAPLWDDLFVGGGGSDVHSWVDGTAPNRVAHVAWRAVGFYWDSATLISFEVKLFETSNIIEFAYCGEGRTNTYSRGGQATVGIESLDQTAGRLVGLNAYNTVVPNTGYRFLPR